MSFLFMISSRGRTTRFGGAYLLKSHCEPASICCGAAFELKARFGAPYSLPQNFGCTLAMKNVEPASTRKVATQ